MGTIKKGQGKKVSNLQMDDLEYKSAEEFTLNWLEVEAFSIPCGC